MIAGIADCRKYDFIECLPATPQITRNPSVTGDATPLRQMNDLRSGSFLEAFRLQQHAGDVVVLGGVADEKVEGGHQLFEQSGGHV